MSVGAGTLVGLWAFSLWAQSVVFPGFRALWKMERRLDKSDCVPVVFKPSPSRRAPSELARPREQSREHAESCMHSSSSPDPLLPRPRPGLANGGLALCHGLCKAFCALLIWTKAALRSTGSTPRSHRQKKPSLDRVILSHDGAFPHGKSGRIVRFQTMARHAC